VIKVGALLALLSGAVQLGLYVAGVKLHVASTRPAAGSTIVFAALMFACAAGMWLMRYWAVLGFMALMALLLLYFSFALIKASSVAGFAISIAGVCVTGLLFFKLVRVLSRLQMPKYPGR
jgi:membrane protein CcdC involved in cytochrome C biogenesis